MMSQILFSRQAPANTGSAELAFNFILPQLCGNVIYTQVTSKPHGPLDFFNLKLSRKTYQFKLIWFHFQTSDFVGSVFNKQHPSNNPKLIQMHKRQQQVTVAKKSLHNLILSLIMGSSVIAIGYAEFDIHSFYLQNNIRNYLVSDGYGQYGFSAVSITVACNKTFKK